MADQRYYGFASINDMQSEFNAHDFMTAQHIRQNVNTSIPARVVKVDKAKKRLTCTPMVHQITPTGEVIAHGKIFDVPYGYVQGGNCLIQVDPVEGDIGFVCFSQRDITRVKRNLKEDAPETLRTHAWEDAVFIQHLHSEEKVAHVIHLDPQEGITISSSQPVKIMADIEVKGSITVEGNLKLTGQVTATGDVKAGSISLQNHTHGGVRSGEGTTGKAE
ncbi:Gp138 family membrane-puncturing spike protein [Entomobacter blattae]|uniref:Phage protein Gp138 N-terminal domain-containing protein n=1 Tax=Entomobacter blattae TaxID=2762277 RepID=A0A7H1NR78_9PROT|nr:Gp138 family membrane-puncturing spike protein [Entomobacter blattae]QNT78288.1 hypothetical protein JGUZn3_10600 [Entomobacter blattae]